MDSIEAGVKTKIKQNISESGKPFTSTLPLEKRLEIFANLVLDRILEEKQLGNLKQD